MDSFDLRKKDVLGKKDKSSKSSWDEKILGLCNKLNLMEDYYTTSSCSGKSVILPEKIGKDGSYYLWTSHDLIDLDNFIGFLKNVDSKLTLKFKTESPILFVVCRDISSAKNLLAKSFEAGFKQSGIIITKKLIGVEIRSGEKLEFPLFIEGKLAVSTIFLREVIKNSNYKRKIGWKKIENLSFLLE